jgi:hypothetical protein
MLRPVFFAEVIAQSLRPAGEHVSNADQNGLPLPALAQHIPNPLTSVAWILSPRRAIFMPTTAG